MSNYTHTWNYNGGRLSHHTDIPDWVQKHAMDLMGGGISILIQGKYQSAYRAGVFTAKFQAGDSTPFDLVFQPECEEL